MKLIDADALWEQITQHRPFDALALIEDAPTVDIDAITESHEEIGYDKGFRDGYAQATVDTVPTEFHDKCMQIEIEKRFELELKEKHGHWISDNAQIADRCSACGLSINWSLYKTPYCPFCGAKMDEVDDE